MTKINTPLYSIDEIELYALLTVRGFRKNCEEVPLQDFYCRKF
jgi:hypothetical protein